MNINERLPHFLVNHESKNILDGMSTEWQTADEVFQATGASVAQLNELSGMGVILQKRSFWRKRDAVRIEVSR